MLPLKFNSLSFSIASESCTDEPGRKSVRNANRIIRFFFTLLLKDKSFGYNITRGKLMEYKNPRERNVQ